MEKVMVLSFGHCVGKHASSLVPAKSGSGACCTSDHEAAVAKVELWQRTVGPKQFARTTWRSRNRRKRRSRRKRRKRRKPERNKRAYSPEYLPDWLRCEFEVNSQCVNVVVGNSVIVRSVPPVRVGGSGRNYSSYSQSKKTEQIIASAHGRTN